jgi:hypothetical protein
MDQSGMKVAGLYSFNRGKEVVEGQYPDLLQEVERAITQVDADSAKTKISAEKTMLDRILYSPKMLNRLFKAEFKLLDWQTDIRIACDYSTAHYVGGYTPTGKRQLAFRALDFRKRNLGVEVQFGKYAFMVYNVCAKMTIFHNQGYIDAGIEIVPVKEFADEMSTGVSYFEQFVWDLEQRGVSNIDIPVLIIGIR